MNTKKIILSLMACTCILSIGPKDASAYSIDTISNQENKNDYMKKYKEMSGTINEISTDKILFSTSNDLNSEMFLNLSKGTIIIDGVSGIPVSVKNLNVHDKIHVYIGQTMTLSLPPIANAKVIITNIPKDDNIPRYVHVESIRNNTNGSVTIVSEGGKYEATIDNTTNLFTYLTKNIVTIDDITIGTNLLLWENPHTLQTKDIPKKINVTKCLITPIDEGWIKEDSKWYFIKDGEKAKGWIKDNEKWYFFNENGTMQTNWVKNNGKWYFLSEDGSMKTGWTFINGVYYYLKNTGEMAHNEYIDGYYLNSNGAF